MERVRDALAPTSNDAIPTAVPHAVVLGNLIELWSLLDAASRDYAVQARVVVAPTRLLLWSLAHRRERHASRLLGVITQPEWAGPVLGDDAVASLRGWRAGEPAEAPVTIATPLEALQHAAETEAWIGHRCARLISTTAHTLVEHALRWQLADTRFAQHQIDVLRGLVDAVSTDP